MGSLVKTEEAVHTNENKSVVGSLVKTEEAVHTNENKSIPVINEEGVNNTESQTLRADKSCTSNDLNIQGEVISHSSCVESNDPMSPSSHVSFVYPVLPKLRHSSISVPTGKCAALTEINH